jgi:heptosyltransferase-2
MHEPSLGLAGRLDLGGAKALLRRVALLVCNDSGTRHIAAAFGVPSLMMLGPTSLEKTDCNLEQVRVYTAGVDCSPCYRRECPIDHRCMTRISPDRVLADALPLLRQAKQRA